MQVELDFTDQNGNFLGTMIISPVRYFETEHKKVGPSIPIIEVISDQKAVMFGEEKVQLLEGFTYEYILRDAPTGSRLRTNDVIKRSTLTNASNDRGLISPGLYTGLLTFELEDVNGKIITTTGVEVRSLKLDYRSDYREMLEFIADRCTDLLLQVRSPSQVKLSPDPSKKPETIEQKYAFLRSLLTSTDFKDALNRITLMPQTNLEFVETEININRGFRGNAKTINQLISKTPRSPLPNSHPLFSQMKSVPMKIATTQSLETTDTIENRFVKYVVMYFRDFLKQIEKVLKDKRRRSDIRLKHDVSLLIDDLNEILGRSLFKELSDLHYIPVSNPVLQRKEGYREVFQAWLKFELAAELVWDAAEDVYGAGKRDVALLYEYWVFFKLVDLLNVYFGLEANLHETLLKKTSDGFGITLRSGRELNLPEHKYVHKGRSFKIQFSYNKTFVGNQKYPKDGSWTRNMRPDYTLSFWPANLSRTQAELQELLVHVHFDAKYRVENLSEMFGLDPEKDEGDGEIEHEKRGLRSGSPAKRADLLKMHAYRDAIRRTAGAYVIYPGREPRQWREYFHELLPGLGAFTMKPHNSNDGIEEIRTFIEEIMDHLSDRASRREEVTYHIYNTYSHEERPRVYNDVPDPEVREVPYTQSRVVLVSAEDNSIVEWMINTKNFIYEVNGVIDPNLLNVNYAVLYDKSKNGAEIDGLWAIEGERRIILGEEVMKLGYPVVVEKTSIFIIYKVHKDKRYYKKYLNLDVFSSSSVFMMSELLANESNGHEES